MRIFSHIQQLFPLFFLLLTMMANRTCSFRCLFCTNRFSSGLWMAASDKLSFGNRMDIKVRLPTRDKVVAQGFLQHPGIIVESAYDKARYTKINETTYVIKFAQIPIPGIDTVSPEIEVEFVTKNHTIRMQSKAWALRGGPIVRDSRFLQSFQIDLVGQLAVEEGEAGLLLAVGHVFYAVQGEKPLLLRAAPGFILDGTIKFIQSCVADFVLKQFSGKLLAAFRRYSAALPVPAG